MKKATLRYLGIYTLLFVAFLLNPQVFYAQNYLTNEEQEIIKIMNEARTKPAAFADKYLKNKNGEAARECYSEMKAMKPIGKLSPLQSLSLAAKDHVDDTGKKGLITHTGSDGSSPSDRIARHCKWTGKTGECIHYGYNKALPIVLDLLIDEGIPGRGHRRIILDDAYNYAGVHLGYHKKYTHMSVITFVGGYE